MYGGEVMGLNIDGKQILYGIPGPKGDTGVGIASGGLAGQVLSKNTDTDYDTGWTTVQSGTNILDNWFFKNPVDQMGVAPITNHTGYYGYCVDRWILSVSSNAQCSFSIEQGYFSISGHFWQVLDLPFYALSGQTITISILDTDGNLSTDTGTIPDIPSIWGFGSGPDVSFNYSSTRANKFTFYIKPKLDSSGNIIPRNLVAAKLEIGDHQTLAYWNGIKWMLRDAPPNYQQIIARCQRFYQRIYIRLNPNSHEAIYWKVQFDGKPTVSIVTGSDSSYISVDTSYTNAFFGWFSNSDTNYTRGTYVTAYKNP